MQKLLQQLLSLMIAAAAHPLCQYNRKVQEQTTAGRVLLLDPRFPELNSLNDFADPGSLPIPLMDHGWVP